MKKIVQRTCLGCKEAKEKKDLIRIVKQNDGNIFIDKTGKANGRGAYICNNVECLEKAIKSKRLDKAFEQKIDSKIILWRHHEKDKNYLHTWSGN